MEMDSETTAGPRMVGFAATWAAVISVTCVLIGEGAAQFSSLNAPTNRGQIPSDSPAKTARPNFNTIDFATTGSTKDQTIVISPCMGEPIAPSILGRRPFIHRASPDPMSSSQARVTGR